MRCWLIRLFTHTIALAVGFGVGIYTLPILTAPPGPDQAALRAVTNAALFKARFDPALPGSDLLHWGEGEIHLTLANIAHHGRLAPGPDYRLYLAPEFIDNKQDFLRIKARSTQIAAVNTFNGFLVAIPPGTDLTAYTTVVVWCEAFSQFITAAKYR